MLLTNLSYLTPDSCRLSDWVQPIATGDRPSGMIGGEYFAVANNSNTTNLKDLPKHRQRTNYFFICGASLNEIEFQPRQRGRCRHRLAAPK